MKREDIIYYEEKRIKILLKNKFIYTCEIEEILDDCVKIKDKFGNIVTISYDEISMITEVADGY